MSKKFLAEDSDSRETTENEDKEKIKYEEIAGELRKRNELLGKIKGGIITRRTSSQIGKISAIIITIAGFYFLLKYSGDTSSQILGFVLILIGLLMLGGQK